ncbi:MAG: nuclear transport factor 2 family protein [Puniceicoccales bacterium]|jgi:hypothetical protein|nr:nuclear transport factor 2 family protein [Puniceicoccales bacterium]
MNLEPDDQTVRDTLMIMTVLSRVGRYGDEKKWEEHQRLFTDKITVDFGHVKPPEITSSQAIKEWAYRAYKGVNTLHLLTNMDVQVNGDKAVVASSGLSRHKRIDTKEFWNIYSFYEHELIRTPEGWKVTRLKMVPIFQEGNEHLLEETYALTQP